MSHISIYTYIIYIYIYLKKCSITQNILKKFQQSIECLRTKVLSVAYHLSIHVTLTFFFKLKGGYFHFFTQFAFKVCKTRE